MILHAKESLNHQLQILLGNRMENVKGTVRRMCMLINVRVLRLTTTEYWVVLTMGGYVGSESTEK